MADVCYVSRNQLGHNEMWIRTLRQGGHSVTPVTVGPDAVGEIRASSAELVVAGPLTDAAVQAVDADIAPVLAVAWAFDLLVEMQDGPTHDAVSAALPRAAGVHVDCAHLAELVVSLGVERDKVSLGAWGIDTDYFSPGRPSQDVRAVAGWGPSELVVLTTRGWSPMYGVDVVLRGFARAAAEDPRLRLAWAGQGPEAAGLRELVRRLGIEPVVHETGPLCRAQLRDWLRSSDLYATAAISDGSSLSLMEALAVGLPVTVTDHPCNREWVTDPRVGTLCSVGESDAVAAAILAELRAKSSEARDLIHRRSLVLKRGDWSRNRQVFLDAVERCLA